MNLLFLGGIFHKENEEQVFKKSKIFVHVAASVHQWHILNGIKNIKDVSLSVLNTMFVGTYPREYKDFYIHKGAWTESGINAKEIGYPNFFGIRTIARAFGLYFSIKKWCKTHKGEKNIIVVYSMNTPFMVASYFAKRKYADIKICLYVPDLPSFFTCNVAKGMIYWLLKKLDCNIMNKTLDAVDGFVLLSKHMNKRVNKNNKPFIVTDGIVSEEKNTETVNSSLQIKNIVYTGKTDEEFGILELIEAFLLLEYTDVQLHIYGNGNADRKLEEISKIDDRIKFFGTVDRKTVLSKQREAFLLVNPRSSKNEFTKYSFPSKTLEYLLAARPVVMHKLEGIPAEYDDFLMYFDSDNPYDMAEKLHQVLSVDIAILNKIGIDGRQYVLAHKNEEKQGQALIDLLNCI